MPEEMTQDPAPKGARSAQNKKGRRRRPRKQGQVEQTDTEDSCATPEEKTPEEKTQILAPKDAPSAQTMKGRRRRPRKQGQVEQTDTEDSCAMPEEKTQVPAPRGARPAQDMELQCRPRDQGQDTQIARAIVSRLKSLLEKGQEVARKAWNKVFNMAKKAANAIIAFAREHPYWTAAIITALVIIAVAVLWPYVLQFLGFGKLGPVAGTFASWWQSLYAGFVTKSSFFGPLFSALQAAGMTLL